jgi:hypothetical protein
VFDKPTGTLTSRVSRTQPWAGLRIGGIAKRVELVRAR